MSEEVSNPTLLVMVETLEEHRERHEGYWTDVWKKLDRAPKWITITMTAMGTLIGFLSSSLMHMLLEKA